MTHSQDLPRPVVLLILTPPEAQLVREALGQMRRSRRGTFADLRRDILQRLETARYSEHELRRLGGLDKER